MQSIQLDLFTFQKVQEEPTKELMMYEKLKGLIDLDPVPELLPGRFYRFDEVYPDGYPASAEWANDQKLEYMEQHNRELWKVVAPLIGRCPTREEYLPARSYDHNEMTPIHMKLSMYWRQYKNSPEYLRKDLHNRILMDLTRPRKKKVVWDDEGEAV